MLPVDLVSLVEKEILSSRREPDGLLHASSDLIGSLRHTQLKAAGAPMTARRLASLMAMENGTMWHKRIHDRLVTEGVQFMQEVKLDRFLPEGWSGTADWIFWDADAGGFVLGDLKTTKGEGIRWIERDGAKQEHLWQLSAYWHALVDSGMPMVEGFAVLYLPMNDTDEGVEPLIAECSPLSRELVHGVMSDRWDSTKTYLEIMESLDHPGWDHPDVIADALANRYTHNPATVPGFFLNEYLAPPMAKVQQIFWNGKQGVFDLKLVPHWSTRFCPFEEPLCDCSTQGVTKIGHYTVEGEYVPREGYELELPAEAPTDSEYHKRRSTTVSI